MKSINCKGNLIDLRKPRVMGILNLTPDSFYDGGRYDSEKKVLERAEQILSEGATFLDLGAYSSRPGARPVSETEERERLIPALENILKRFPDALISIDTWRHRIAEEAVSRGACMINDISAGNMDQEMFGTMARLQVPYVLMHMVGTPQTMQKHTQYKDLIRDMVYYFSEKIFTLRQMGLNDLIIDLGFGFSKTLDQNYELLSNLDLFRILELPILTGISRKSMLYKLLGTGPENALNATTAAHAVALAKGSSILRVHDVKEAVETVMVLEKIRQYAADAP